MKLNSITLAVGMLLAIAGAEAQAQSQPVKNIVLVHGAFVGGAGWRPVYDRLTQDGYHVTLVQQPLTSFAEDVTATRRIIDQQNGPVILVGHSYGGAIISEAGNDSKWQVWSTLPPMRRITVKPRPATVKNIPTAHIRLPARPMAI